MKVIRPELRKARSSCSRVVRRLSPEITAPPCLPTSETQSTSSVFLANDIPNVCDGIAAPFRKRIQTAGVCPRQVLIEKKVQRAMETGEPLGDKLKLEFHSLFDCFNGKLEPTGDALDRAL